MALNVFLALLSGYFIGAIFVLWILLHGLTNQEKAYFVSFLEALRNGDYDELSDDERSEEHDED